MGNKIIKKSIFFFAIVVISDISQKTIQPIMARTIALNQMNTSVDSHLWYDLYKAILDYKLLIFLFIVVMLFKNDVIKFMKKKEKKEDEEE